MTTDNHNELKKDIRISASDLKHSLSSRFLGNALWTEQAISEFNEVMDKGLFPREALIRAVTEDGEEAAALAYDIAEQLADMGSEDSYTSLRSCLYYRAAEQGCTAANAKAAEVFSFLYGLVGNEPNALNWAKKGAAEGDGESLWVLGMFSEDPRFSAEVPGDTFDLYLQAAEKGSIRAMYTLYEIYSVTGVYYDPENHGKEIKGKLPLFDPAEARKWLISALYDGYDEMDEEEQAWVLEGLSEDIKKEQAEDRDPRIADLRKRARAQDADAQMQLGCWYAQQAAQYKDDQRSRWYAEYLLKPIAESGSAEAQYELGMHYRNCAENQKSTIDKLQMETESDKFLEKSAAQGYTSAEYEYGKRYVQDPAAMAYLKKAAEKNYAPAVYELGSCYLNGKGVKADPGKAAELIRKALKDREGLAGSVPVDQAEALLADIEKQIRESKRASRAGFFERHQGQLMGIGAAIGLILFEMAYRALGAGLFGEPTVNIHGFLRILLLGGSAAGIFACTILALMSAAAYIGLEGFMSYPAMLAGLFILFMKKYPIVNRISLIACGVIIVIHVLAILFDR